MPSALEETDHYGVKWYFTFGILDLKDHYSKSTGIEACVGLQIIYMGQLLRNFHIFWHYSSSEGHNHANLGKYIFACDFTNLNLICLNVTEYNDLHQWWCIQIAVLFHILPSLGKLRTHLALLRWTCVNGMCPTRTHVYSIQLTVM